MQDPIAIVVCIDVEPDERYQASLPAGDWLGFEAALACAKSLRPRLAAATGAPARLAWFLRMDPQVAGLHGRAAWVAERYASEIAGLERAGDEIGLHAHAFRWDASRDDWLAEHGDPQWLEHCVRSSFAAYRGAFGRPCRSFRFGDHWMSDETMALLCELGVRCDLTLEPGCPARPSLKAGEPHSGCLPEYHDVPRRPYRPSRSDYRKAAHAHPDASHALWELPLSTAREIGRFALLKRAAMALGVDLRRGRNFKPLFLEAPTPRFTPMFRDASRGWPARYLAPVVRCDAFGDAPRRRRIEANLEVVLAHRDVRRMRFLTPQGAIETLQHAPSLSRTARPAPQG